MSEVVIYRHPHRAVELFFDAADIARFEAPFDLIDVPCDGIGHKRCGAIHREIGAAHLNITFKPGKRATWREVAEAP